MSDKEKVIEYELQIEDMLNTLNSNISAFGDKKKLSEFEQGRQLAYTEIMDIIKTRYSMIHDVLNSND